MLLSIPFELCSSLFKYGGAEKILSFIDVQRSFTLKQLIESTRLSRNSTRPFLQALLSTEHIQKRGRVYVATDKIRGGSIEINLRDVESDALFRWKGTRQIILYAGKLPSTEVSRVAGISYRMTKWITRKLSLMGVLSGHQVNRSFLKAYSSPLEIVPRSAHRFVLENIVSTIKEKGLVKHALVFYGDASWGKNVPTLPLLVLFRGSIASTEQRQLMESYVAVAGTATATYGTMIDVSFALEEAWLAHQLGITATVHPTLLEASNGLFIYGEQPRKEDYFELLHSINPPLPSRLIEMLKKGYIVQDGDRYVFTQKAIKTFQEKAPTYLLEVVFPILDRKVKLVMIGKPRNPQSV